MTFFRRLASSVSRPYHRTLTQPHSQATADDVYYCYRLLLLRDPDEGGFAHWTRLVEQRNMDLATLRAEFLGGDEFKQLQEKLHTPQLVDLGRFKMYVRLEDRVIGAGIAQTRSYEPYVQVELQPLLQPGAVVVDIGANIGYFTLLAAALVGPSGRVLAFEPNPDNVALIQLSLTENGFENVDLYPYAVSDEDQDLQLLVEKTNSDARLFDPAVDKGYDASLIRTVRAVRLDDLLADAGPLDVLKMDIEGAESRALRGMERLIQATRPVIFTEFSPILIEAVSHVTPQSYLEMLIGHGYDLYILDRVMGKSETPCSVSAILDAHARSGLTHLDLVAYPRG